MTNKAILNFLKSPEAERLFGTFRVRAAIVAFTIGAKDTPDDCAEHSHLSEWLTDPRAAKYFEESFALKLSVLSALINGDCLAEVARQHGVTRAAASKQARRAKAVFGNLGLTPTACQNEN